MQRLRVISILRTFLKIQMKVAQIVSAEHVEGADKLLKLQMNIGEETNKDSILRN